MKLNEAIKTSHFEVSRLACRNWQEDGCPPDSYMDYWRQAASQIEAKRLLSLREGKMEIRGETKRERINLKGVRTTRTRLELV